MSRTLNFNNLKKRYMTVTFPNEEQTSIMINTPTKKILEEFVGMQSIVEDSSKQSEVMDAFYSVVAKIMSHNKGGVKITKDFLEEYLDFEDIMTFVQSYTEFIQEITNQKN